MKRKSVGAKIIAVVMLSMLMILLTGCNGADKKASTISTAAAVAEAAETAEPLNVVGITQHVEGKVYTFDKDNAYKFSSDGEAISSSDSQPYPQGGIHPNHHDEGRRLYIRLNREVTDKWSFIRRMNGKVMENRITTGTSTGWKAAPFTNINAIDRNSSMAMKTTGRLMKPWKHPGKRTIPTCRIG